MSNILSIGFSLVKGFFKFFLNDEMHALRSIIS
jgi:hypothetical protein